MRGAGHLKIEMHFLADVWITCDACGGKRYDAQTLESNISGKSIADVLQMSCGGARFLRRCAANSPELQLLCDVGLDYIARATGNDAFGREAQRVKLATELARFDTGKTLVFDEPTTGLHFEDLRKLLSILPSTIDLGNTVVVIEHNLDVIKSADWIIDLGRKPAWPAGNSSLPAPRRLADYGRAWPPHRRTSRQRCSCSWTADALIPIIRARPVSRAFSLTRPKGPNSVFRNARFSQTNKYHKMFRCRGRPTDGRGISTRGRDQSGFPCRWSGQVLAKWSTRSKTQKLFPRTNWNNRTLVKSAHQKQFGWFFHAQTGEEWLLKLSSAFPNA